MAAFKSQTVLGNAALLTGTFDVLIIGSGAGGSAAAEVLSRNGKKVLILEAGSNFFKGLDDPDPKKLGNVFTNDELKMDERNFLMPDPLVDPRTFRASESDGVRTQVGDINHLAKTVGGGAVVADLKTPRFWPSDFHLGELSQKFSGTNFANWPVDYDQLEPFYYHIEKMMGVQGIDGTTPFDPPRPSGGFPMAPGAPMYMGLKLSQAAEKLGYHPLPFPGAVNSQPFDGRPACVDCGFCVGYGCPTNARGTPPVTMLRKALLNGNCVLLAETKVVRLLYSGRKITGVEALGPKGEKLVYKADQYILAASPIESARLLMLSDSSGQLGNSSGQVGRNLMFHSFSAVVGIFKSDRLHSHRGRTVSHGLMDFRGNPKDIHDSDHPLGGIIEFGASPMPIEEAGYYYKNFGMRGRYLNGSRLKKMMQESSLRDHLLSMLMHAEDAPQLTNRVDLDPEVKDLDGLPVARITYKAHAFEIGAANFYRPKMMDVIKATGANTVYADTRGDQLPQTRHIMGTLRSGTDPKTSVCNPQGRFHDLDNLYAADGSLFPTSSGFNPTLTIAALATYVGASIVAGTSPERAL